MTKPNKDQAREFQTTDLEYLTIVGLACDLLAIPSITRVSFFYPLIYIRDTDARLAKERVGVRYKHILDNIAIVKGHSTRVHDRFAPYVLHFLRRMG